MSVESYKMVKEGDYYATEVLGQKYGFRKWSWGDKNALTTECSLINPVTGMVSYNQINFNEQLIYRTVYKFVHDKFEQITIEEIRTMDAQLGERLFQITSKLNLISGIETQNL